IRTLSLKKDTIREIGEITPCAIPSQNPGGSSADGVGCVAQAARKITAASITMTNFKKRMFHACACVVSQSSNTFEKTVPLPKFRAGIFVSGAMLHCDCLSTLPRRPTEGGCTPPARLTIERKGHVQW